MLKGVLIVRYVKLSGVWLSNPNVSFVLFTSFAADQILISAHELSIYILGKKWNYGWCIV